MQIVITLLPYLAVFSLLLSVGLFGGINRKLYVLRQRVGRCETRMQTETAQLTTGVNALKQRLEELEEDQKAGSTAPAATGSLNGTVRRNVLKMHRLGQSTEKIADSLRISKGEVDLLVKVHRIVMRPYEGAVTAGEGG